MRKISIGNTSLNIKDYYCCRNNEDYIAREDNKLWLYVNITDVCTASCPFCVNPSKKTGKSSFDKDKFRKIFTEIADHIYGVSITGGEPMLEPELVDDVVDVIQSVSSFTGEIEMVTNGINLKRLVCLRHISDLGVIHLSRHRIDDKANRKIFGIEVPTKEEIRELADKEIMKGRIVLNCVLEKSGISTVEDISDYLEMAASMNVDNVSFIGMFIANPWCKENYVHPINLDFSRDERFHFWTNMADHDFCSCSSGDYKAENRYIRFYYRCPGTVVPSYTRQLVYDSDNHLLDGFNGKIIL